jgi:hypothetical protein
MKRQVTAISFGLALAAFSMSNASAEEKCKMSGGAAAANTTYTQQHVIDVGDVPGHQVRIFEIHRTYPADTKPNCEGLRTKEDWTRGFSDYTDRNGPNLGYTVTTLENGDKIFSEDRGVSQTVVGPNGAKKSTAVGVSRYTGGTGKYQSIRGIVRWSNIFDPEKNYNEEQREIEYWFEK